MASSVVLIDTSVGPTELFLMKEGKGQKWFDTPFIRTLPFEDNGIDPKVVVKNITANLWTVNVTNPEFNGHKLKILIGD